MATPLFNIAGLLTVISNCDTGTGWNITDVDTDIKVEGIGAGFDAIRDGTTITYTFPSAVDMSALDIHIRQWLQHTFPTYLETKAIGGIQLFISDGTNTAAWYVGGSDTHKGSYQLFQADLSATPDSGTLPNLTAVTSFGFILVHATSARNVANTYWDLATFMKGYEIYGGTSIDKVSWRSLADADTLNSASVQYGVSTLVLNGAIYLNSGIWFGDSASTNDLYFDGTNEVIVFYAADEKTGLYKLVGTGNGTGITDVDFSGSVLKSASSPFLLDMSGANITAFKMDGAKVENASANIFKAGQSINGTVFTGCGAMTHGGSDLQNCTISLNGLITVLATGLFYKNTISNSTGAVAVSTTNLNNLDKGIFNSSGTGYAVDLGTISADISMSWDNVDNGYAATNGSTGNETILVNVDNGITLIINVASGASTPTINNIGTGTVLVVTGQRNFKFTISPSVIDYEWRVYSVTTLGSLDGSVELTGEEYATSDNQTYTYTYSVDTPIAVQIISYPDHNYEEETRYYTLKDSDQDVTIDLTVDNNN